MGDTHTGGQNPQQYPKLMCAERWNDFTNSKKSLRLPQDLIPGLFLNRICHSNNKQLAWYFIQEIAFRTLAIALVPLEMFEHKLHIFLTEVPFIGEN